MTRGGWHPMGSTHVETQEPLLWFRILLRTQASRDILLLLLSLAFYLTMLLFFFFFQHLFIFGTERDRAWTGERQREGDTESETGSRLWAISPEPDAGLELTDRKNVTWAEVGRLTDCATQAPHAPLFLTTKDQKQMIYDWLLFLFCRMSMPSIYWFAYKTSRIYW